MIAKLETAGECRILRVSGRIDFESALDFEQQINAMIQQGGDCFIIELSEVELLSSAGLRVLLSTAKRVSHRDSALGLAAPSQVVSQVFEISHFNLLFKIFPSVAEAVAALKGTTYSATPVAAPPGSPEKKEAAARSTGESSRAAEPRISAGERHSQQEPAAADSVQAAPKMPPVSEPPRATRPSAEPVSAPSSKPVTPPHLAATEIIRPVAQPPGPSRPPEPVPPPLPSQPPKPPPLDVAKPQPQGDMRGARQVPEKPLSGAETTVPVPRPPQAAAGQRAGGTPPRVEAPFPAQLEVRAEGKSYPCKDGDVIGAVGGLGKAYFAQIPGLSPRHLLIGKAEGRWFVFTPKNVQHPFSMDGHLLVEGERKFLDYAEHQLELSGHVFGLRLIPEQKKRGFFARLFGKWMK